MKKKKPIMAQRSYTKGVDFEYLKAMGVEITFYQAWQLGLFHKDLKGKFVWYPRKGTLMFESETGSQNKIKQSGDFMGQNDKTEEVYKEIIRKIDNE